MFAAGCLETGIETIKAMQLATKRAFQRVAFGGIQVPLRLPIELQHMILQDFHRPMWEKDTLDEAHKTDTLHVIVSNTSAASDDDINGGSGSGGNFILILSKSQALQLEQQLNMLPKTPERNLFGNVLYNFYAKHQNNIIFEISAALYDDLVLEGE